MLQSLNRLLVLNCKSFSDVGEPTRAKVSYELAGRLLSVDEEAKIQLNKDIESLRYCTAPAAPVHKPGKYLKLWRECVD